MLTLRQDVTWTYSHDGVAKHKYGIIFRIFDDTVILKIFDPYYGEFYYRRVPANQVEATEPVKEIAR